MTLPDQFQRWRMTERGILWEALWRSYPIHPRWRDATYWSEITKESRNGK